MSTGMSYNAPHGSWHVLYHAALFENDRNKLPQRIEEAERAILSRIESYFSPPRIIFTDHIEEDEVLDDALYALRALRSCVHSEVPRTPFCRVISPA